MPQHLARKGLVTIGACALVALGVLACLIATPAYAYNENYHVSGGGCGGDCHTAIPLNEANCGTCHQFTDGHFPLTGEFSQSGPHGGYATTTKRCPACHTLHDADSSFKLLEGATVKATCFTCHDGTQGYGVYGAIQARTGSPAAGGHSVDTTSVVPGGDAASGGSAISTAFRGPNGTMTCSDCHSPHDSNTVAPFTGERVRIRAHEGPIYSTKLLKQKPSGASTATTVYGSDWCLGCHDGRGSGGTVHNHPVDSKESTTSPYYYNYLAVYRTAGFPTDGQYESGVPVPLTNAYARIGAVGNVLVTGNGGHTITTSPNWAEADFHSSPWLMTYPRSPLHAGHAPICQQCHEDKRNCGTLSADGTTANIIRDGLWGTDADGLQLHPTYLPNPRFQNFPHETEDPKLLVESGDDLCLNCHPMTQLP